jgi:hypothetical protein
MGIPVVVSNAGFFAGTVSTCGGTTSLKLVNTGKTALYHHKITSPSNESTNEPSIKRNKVPPFARAVMHATLFCSNEAHRITPLLALPSMFLLSHPPACLADDTISAPHLHLHTPNHSLNPSTKPASCKHQSLDKLAPALDFLPIETESEGGVKGYTSEELVALEAYRAQYANYRLRESDGAHGERPSANPHVRGSLHEHEAKVRNGVGERYKTREHAPRSEAGSIKKLKLSDFVRFNKF